jgi:UDP-2-acetamido-2,6-beta-L-arabino-hexul-4-ose reductase
MTKVINTSHQSPVTRHLTRIGITGQAGFVGTHLYNTLGLRPEFERIPFEDDFFLDNERLKAFVTDCDVIVHLAAMNRHGDPRVIYDTNLELVDKLIAALDATGSKAHILFSSSTQEDRDNPYGKSKKEGRTRLAAWAKRSGGAFTGLVIPNVFGPFGHPYYNSVVATFCHQLSHNETPRVDIDATLKLIYVGDLVGEFIRAIETPVVADELLIPHGFEVKVTEILSILEGFKTDYLGQGILPCLDDPLTLRLFNTFLCYVDHDSFFPYKLRQNTDDRGSFVETMKLHSGGQVSFSTTRPGITRGNHYHTRKAERFAVIRGRARIELRRIGTDKVFSFDLDGSQPSFVDMPIWYTHNITNTGEEELMTLFWINEHFVAQDPDTFFEEV